MKPSELEDPRDIIESSEPKGHVVAFLPHLRLKRGHAISGVEFLPLRDAAGAIPAPLETGAAALEKILSSYVDRRGESLTNCVVATIPGRGWDLSRDDFDAVRWAASLLFLGAWARNEYFPKVGGAYVNSSQFRLVGQAYSGAMPRYISLSARRRDGSTLDGGYKHGQVKFHLPVQVSLRDCAEIDEELLAALDRARAAGSDVLDRLRTAIPFVELANSDDDFMTLHNEAILMGSAFEQLLRGDASSYKLGQRFAEMFSQFGNVTVSEAQKARPEIEVDTSDPARAAAQSKWWVHRKWMEELYDVRSKVVHKGSPASRTWGWSMFEHLAMAAHVFPLTVKLLLAEEDHYVLTDRDRVASLIVDKLLASPKWIGDDEEVEAEQSWARILSKTRLHYSFEKATEDFLRRQAGSS
jgi:hypothetical protein